jgi:predicted transposase YbfD/YdcC
MIGMVEAEVERHGKTSRARRFYLGSAPLSAAQFARAVRARWGIENQLHWVMDVVFHDDLMRLRSDHGPARTSERTHRAKGRRAPSPARRRRCPVHTQ